MDEDPDGSSADTTEGAEEVAGRFGVKPEDGVTSADHNKRLGTHTHTHTHTQDTNTQKQHIINTKDSPNTLCSSNPSSVDGV